MVNFEAQNVDTSDEKFAEMAKDVCMQIAALNAAYIDRDAVSPEVIEKEREILIAQIKNDEKNAKKPENIIKKMVDGRIGKFYENNCLVDQAFVKDSAMTVGPVSYTHLKSKTNPFL